MDWTTIIGALLGVGIVGYGVIESRSWAAFLNIHGFILVMGGTFAAILINTPLALFKEAFKAAFMLFSKRKGLPIEAAIKIIVGLAEKARRSGNMAIESDGRDVGDDGFLQMAIDACLTTSDEKLAREILSQKLRQIKNRHTETANVFRTMSILFPMFGLVGTLIGIVTVLKNISNPKNVGSAMAVALSTAFFGILLANLVCVPIAGKLRLRSLEEALEKEILAEGILKIFFTSEIPTQISLYLESFMRTRLETAGEGAPAPGAEGKAAA